MFKKLLGNLPFNPSLINQLSFYAQRVKRESTVRRTGFILLALTMVVQFFAVLSPPQSSLAESDNDLVRGGTMQGILSACANNTQDYRTILDYYGISCDMLGGANHVQLNSRALNGNLDSLGRNPVPDKNPKTGKASDFYTVNVPGASQTLYMKNLWYWDSGASSTYPAIELLSNKTHEQMWILLDCGNVVTLNRYQPPQPPPPPPPPPPAPPQVLSCSNLVMNVANDSKVTVGTKVTVLGQASGQNIKSGQKVDMYYEYLDANTNKVITSASTLGIGFNGTTANDTQPHTFSTDTPGQYTIRLIVKYDGSKVAPGSSSGNCIKHISVQKVCDKSTNGKDLENCTDQHKTATNVTQNKADANGTTAHAGDTIKYTLSVTNTANITVPKYEIQENISDILDYADVVDLGGGTKDSNHLVTWPALDIKAKQVVKKFITVRVKNPIPSTPVSSSDKGHFDCIITNYYGDSVAIKIECPIAKTIETTTTLPNTGPGTSLAIGFGITAFVGYFFARSRLLASELDIVRHDFSNGGA